MARGVAGLIIDGGVRDADQIEALGFPVFSRCLCIRGTTKHRDAPGQIGEPLTFGDCVVKTGDLVAGDRDGLVAVGAGDLDTVLQSAADREAKEAGIIARVRAGETTMEIFNWD
jgi:4-hydroxy-4-methyl-2-oxoglutarate aldolase